MAEARSSRREREKEEKNLSRCSNKSRKLQKTLNFLTRFLFTKQNDKLSKHPQISTCKMTVVSRYSTWDPNRAPATFSMAENKSFITLFYIVWICPTLIINAGSPKIMVVHARWARRVWMEGQQPGYSKNMCGQGYSDNFPWPSAQIAVLTVAREQAHHKLLFGINFSPQLSTPIRTMLFRQSEPFRQCYSDTPGKEIVTPK